MGACTSQPPRVRPVPAFLEPVVVGWSEGRPVVQYHSADGTVVTRVFASHEAPYERTHEDRVVVDIRYESTYRASGLARPVPTPCRVLPCAPDPGAPDPGADPSPFRSRPLAADDVSALRDGCTPYCVICHGEWEVEANAKVRTLPCGHTYHTECIDEWLNRSPTCPFCKTDASACVLRASSRRGSSRRLPPLSGVVGV